MFGCHDRSAPQSVVQTTVDWKLASMPGQTRRKRLHRYEIPHGIRFLTFSCRHRLQLFANDTIKDLFIQRLSLSHTRQHIALIAWVIMPEHIHLLVRPTKLGQTIEAYLSHLKSRFAKQVLTRWRELNAPILQRIQDSNGRSHFWQLGGGYDRNIVSSEEFVEKLNYIHQNPVKRGLVGQPEEWRWSSARFYMQHAYTGPAITPIDPG